MPVATLMKLGSKGDDVKRLQSQLKALGFDPGPVDGDFGSMTEAAVRRLQRERNLTVDGIVGPQTQQAMDTGAVSGGSVSGGAVSDGPGDVAFSLVAIGLAAEEHFGLTVGECCAPGAPARWSPVSPGHAEHSFHFRGEAFDAGGSAEDMRRFAAWVTERFPGVTELIHNPNGSIKNGGAVDPEFWGDATWSAHCDHVHLAITG